ncbi:MAG: replication-associated recombination protein A [Myxococcales bacterium]|nr:replication-associated recombination protein A [Myxococcales bacterium]
MRPTRVEDIQGQEKLLGHGRLLRRLIEADRVPSMILWGPPGTGKTTLAGLLAQRTKAHFMHLSAVLSGVADLRKCIQEAKRRRGQYGERTVLFVDEIHRWSKSQQDALLDAVERGLLTLVGATTENPSFELNAALLSRVRVFVLEALSVEALQLVLRRAISEPKGLGLTAIEVDEEALEVIAQGAHGDARRALSALEIAARDAMLMADKEGTPRLRREEAEEGLAHRTLLYDKVGEEHYGVVSAFIKSMRGSDPDAAVYYMARMLESGEDPRFVLRRIVIFASEDVGNADPTALQVALNASHAYEFVGMPEGVLPMTQAVLYLATAPKSNSALTTYGLARKAVHTHGPLAVPTHLLNAVTPTHRIKGHGQGYRYPHDLGGLVRGETYLPEALVGSEWYVPKAPAERQAPTNKVTEDQTTPPGRSVTTVCDSGDSFDS